MTHAILAYYFRIHKISTEQICVPPRTFHFRHELHIYQIPITYNLLNPTGYFTYHQV